MSNFGLALDSIGLFGSSTYNPRDFENKCVFVTMAYLQGLTADQFAINVQREGLYEANEGCGIGDIYDMLERQGVTKGPYLLRFNIPRIHSCLDRFTQVCGIIYSRPYGTSHCVTVRKTARDAQHRNGLKYICYQRETEGRDLTWDAEAGELEMIFSLYGRGSVHSIPPKKEDNIDSENCAP
ncbi:uncharacterized protein LY89DRAFT_744215 [Mollisia scopiformis]|uniref:Uncharacterized protein n=1 Tax=Mollisia scopiformis TaxID=149040 RepID=A0A194XUE0_MOLSC|nr:uncharacterized protein LY89DRAFT_744215 [Mollisia scopiformis]KUJ23756.1 hypothetical protein LY89DRAFT_744215 [Mollisia scopiformis]